MPVKIPGFCLLPKKAQKTALEHMDPKVVQAYLYKNCEVFTDFLHGHSVYGSHFIDKVVLEQPEARMDVDDLREASNDEGNDQDIHLAANVSLGQ